MADDQPDYKQRKDEIKRELVRNPISEPLYSEIHENASAIFNVMVEVNLQFRGGRDRAFQLVQDLTREALRNKGVTDQTDVPVSVGSTANPYMSGQLSGDVIKEIIRLDAQHARAESPANASESEIRSHFAIYRVWKNFAVHPLIDRSIITVKADAARRAFLAEGRGIVWAVIDSGVDGAHDHFKETDTLKLQAPLRHYDFTKGVQGDNAPSALEDKFGHGSHVTGIIAGGIIIPRSTDESKLRAVRTRMDEHQNVVPDIEALDSITGMAPFCKIVSLKVLDDNGNGDVARVIAALDFVQQVNDYGRQNLIHGVNLSLGYEFDPRWFACGQSPICAEVNRLVRAGVIVVVAAGNTGYGTLSSKARATGAGFLLTINDPGNAEYAITVGSTHREMPHTYGVSYFSSKGPTGDGRMKPDLLAPGERILSCQSSGRNATGDTKTYVEDTGTSMSAPHVSGVIASFLSIRKEFIGRPDEVKQIFLDSATDLKRERTFQGSGVVDLMRAIQSV